MGKIYERDTFLFGPVFILDGPLPSDNQSLEEKEEYIKERKDQTKLKQKGHHRVVEKIKEIRQNFSKAVGKQ